MLADRIFGHNAKKLLALVEEGLKLSMDKKFLYSLKLTNGKRVQGEGFNIEDAAKDAKVALSDVKRAMPIRIVQTDAEKKAEKEKKKQRRRRAKAALKIARAVQKERRERKKAGL